MGKAKPIITILIFALVLRLININQSLWLDEAIGAIAARDFSYSAIVKDFMLSDNHPPLYYLSLKFWTSVFGFTELAIRSLSISLGILNIFVVYQIAKKFKTKRKYMPEIAALILATSQFHVYYSQEARMYIPVAFFASLAFWGLLSSKKSKNYKPWLAYAAGIFGLMFFDYAPIFLLPMFWIWAILGNQSKDWWKKFLLAHLPLLIFGLIWLPTFLKQVESGKMFVAKLPAWKELSGRATAKNAFLLWAKFTFGRISLLNKQLYLVIIALVSAPIGLSLLKTLKREAIVLWLWFLGPISIGFLASFIFPAFSFFRFTYALPALYLLFVYGAYQFKDTKITVLIISTLVLFNFVALGIYYSNTRQQREQWKQAVEYLESQPPGIAIFEFPEPFAPYRWYEGGEVSAIGVTNSVSADQKETIEITKRVVAGQDTVYYFEYLQDLTDPNNYVTNTLAESGFSQIRSVGFEGVGEIVTWQKD